MSQIAPAVGIAFGRPWAYVVALFGAAGMTLPLMWGAGLVAHYPTGWELFATPRELTAIGSLSAVFGLLVAVAGAVIVAS